jgi:hypothetical protein
MTDGKTNLDKIRFNTVCSVSVRYHRAQSTDCITVKQLEITHIHRRFRVHNQTLAIDVHTNIDDSVYVYSKDKHLTKNEL